MRETSEQQSQSCIKEESHYGSRVKPFLLVSFTGRIEGENPWRVGESSTHIVRRISVYVMTFNRYIQYGCVSSKA